MLLLQNQFVISGQAQSIGFPRMSDEDFLGTAQEIARVIFMEFDISGVGRNVTKICRRFLGWRIVIHVILQKRVPCETGLSGGEQRREISARFP